MALAAGTYWHPLNLPHYITFRDLTEFSEARVVAPVISASSAPEGSEYLLSAVWAPTYAGMVAGEWEILATLSFAGTGYHAGEWEAIPGGAQAEVYIGMVLETRISCEDLAIGHAEVRCR